MRTICYLHAELMLCPSLPHPLSLSCARSLARLRSPSLNHYSLFLSLLSISFSPSCPSSFSLSSVCLPVCLSLFHSVSKSYCPFCKNSKAIFDSVFCRTRTLAHTPADAQLHVLRFFLEMRQLSDCMASAQAQGLHSIYMPITLMCERN
jgi:hypothetical protein